MIHPSLLQLLLNSHPHPQILFKTASGEWQSIQLQDAVTTATTPTSPVVTTTASQPAPAVAASKRTAAGGRKERTLAKIAPAGGILALNTPQLTPATQAVQTISINGVQVQGVPVTITNAGGECWMQLHKPQLHGELWVMSEKF